MSVIENRTYLTKLLNKSMQVRITDGRTLIGIFLCTDKNANIVLGSCKEYTNFDIKQTDIDKNEPRSIGLSMIPGHHIVSINIDEPFSKL